MLNRMTFRMPKRVRKKGISRIKKVSEIWEMESKRFGCCTPNESGYVLLKSFKNGLPKAFVICSAAPSNSAKTKNNAVFFFLNNTKASSPSDDTNDFLRVSLRKGGDGGMVNA